MPQQHPAAADPRAAIIVCLDFGDAEYEERVAEIVRLVSSAGVLRHRVIGGRRSRPDPKFYAGAGKMQEKIAVELQQMWREQLGVQLELRQIERKVFLSAQSRLDYDMSASSWIGDYNDANTFLDMFMSNSGNNRTGWKSARYDELIRQANLQTDPQRRAEIFQQAETLLVREETPIVPLYFYAGFNYFDPAKVTGIYQNILDEHALEYIGRIGPADKRGVVLGARAN